MKRKQPSDEDQKHAELLARIDALAAQVAALSAQPRA
jgi:hypothetical protein